MAQMIRINLQQRLTMERTWVSPSNLLVMVMFLQMATETVRIHSRSKIKLKIKSQITRCLCDLQYWQFQTRQANMARGRLQSLRSGQLSNAINPTIRKLYWKYCDSFIQLIYYQTSKIIDQGRRHLSFNLKKQTLAFTSEVLQMSRNLKKLCSLLMMQDFSFYAELEKVKKQAPNPLHPYFLSGYLTFGIPPELSHTIKEVINQLMSMVAEQLITPQNVLELLVIIKFQVIPPLQKEKRISIHQLLQPFLTQISLDNTYFQRNLFQKYSPQKLNVECLICLTDINTSQLCYFGCSHLFHKECFSQYAKEKIINRQLPFTCPQEDCPIQILIDDIRQFLPQEIREKYEEFTFQKYVEDKKQGISWCPTPGCQAVFQADERQSYYHCPACQKQYCLRCRCFLHRNMSCQEYQEISNLGEEQKNFMFFVKGAQFKQCPNCKFWVQKSHGCNHMTCRCKYEFCYVCGGKYQFCACKGYNIENRIGRIERSVFNERAEEERVTNPFQIWRGQSQNQRIIPERKQSQNNSLPSFNSTIFSRQRKYQNRIKPDITYQKRTGRKIQEIGDKRQRRKINLSQNLKKLQQKQMEQKMSYPFNIFEKPDFGKPFFSNKPEKENKFSPFSPFMPYQREKKQKQEVEYRSNGNLSFKYTQREDKHE